MAELAGPPGDVGYGKMEGGSSVHVPLLIAGDHSVLSLHGNCAGGYMKPLFSGLCRGPTISDRFFVGGPMQLRGFLPAGIGPRSVKGGSVSPGGDALGGNLYYTGSLAASVAPPGVLQEYGIRVFGFVNAGSLVGCSDGVSVARILQSTRSAVGGGISAGTPMGRMEVSYAWPIRYGPRDARRNMQFGFGFNYG